MGNETRLLTTHEWDVIADTSQYIALVSFIAAIIVIIVVLGVPTLRNGDRFQTVAIMCLWNALYESTYVFGRHQYDDEHACNTLAVFDQAGAIGVVLWNFMLATELYFTVVLHGKVKSSGMKKLLAHKVLAKHITTVLGVVFFSLIPLFANEYGQVGDFCWIKSDDGNDDAFRFAFFYVPLWLVVMWEIFVYFQIVRVFRSLRDTGILTSSYAKKANLVLNQLGLYPLMLMLAWLFPTINRIQNSVDRNRQYYWLFEAQAVSMHLQGVMFAAVFFFHDPQVIAEVRRQIQHICEQGCSRQQPPDLEASAGEHDPSAAIVESES